MRSRLSGLLAAVLAAAMPLSACSSPGDGDQGVPASSGTGADTVSSDSSLDARYGQGAYGAWSVELPGDPHDTEAYGMRESRMPGSPDTNRHQSTQIWVSDAGDTAVMSVEPYYYATTLTGVNLADGLVAWSLGLRDHRFRTADDGVHGKELQDHELEAPRSPEVHCLPQTVADHVVCDRVGLIDMTDGSVTPIAAGADFKGVYQGTVVGNVFDGSGYAPVGVAAWDVSGREIWRVNGLGIGRSGVGEGWLVAEVLGGQGGGRWSVLRIADGSQSGEITVKGTAYVGASDRGPLSLTAGQSLSDVNVTLYDQAGHEVSSYSGTTAVALGVQASFVDYMLEEAPARPLSYDALTAMLGSQKEASWLSHADTQWWWRERTRQDRHSDDVTGAVRAQAPDTVFPVQSLHGAAGSTVVGQGEGGLGAYDVSTAEPVWTLGTPRTSHYSPTTTRGGSFLFYVDKSGAGSPVTVTLLAPGLPTGPGTTAGADGAGGRYTWQPATSGPASTLVSVPGAAPTSAAASAAPSGPASSATPSTPPAPPSTPPDRPWPTPERVKTASLILFGGRRAPWAPAAQLLLITPPVVLE